MKRRVLHFAMLAGAATAAQAPLWGQMHTVQKPETVVRAVGVWEWTGEEVKPTASRLVPVSVYINRQLEDAGVYLARPVPFALQTGTVFELEKSGMPDGTLELAYARHLETPDKPRIDDGWFAYGAYKPEKAPVLTTKKSGALPVVVASGGNKPHFGSTPSSASSNDSKTDAAGGTVDRSTAAGGGTSVSASPAQTPGANEPTMRRRTDADSTASNSDSDSAKDDPERPTLRKRTPEQTKAVQKQKNTASVNGVGDLNDDPDRPNLHRGKPASRLDEQDLPPLTGLPADMHQRVAVSDARDRPEHDFRRAWESDAQRSEVLGKLEEMARARLAQYGDAPAPPAAAAPAQAAAKTAAARKRAVKPSSAPAPAVLNEEALNGYTLSYGGAATYFYSASSPGSGGVARYVTLVAQQEPLGELKVALSSVTDAVHLDRTPEMRLVDVVDAEASNRASLLLELRGQTTRQFALYRVIGAQAEQVLVAGTAE